MYMLIIGERFHSLRYRILDNQIRHERSVCLYPVMPWDNSECIVVRNGDDAAFITIKSSVCLYKNALPTLKNKPCLTTCIGVKLNVMHWGQNPSPMPRPGPKVQTSSRKTYLGATRKFISLFVC